MLDAFLIGFRRNRASRHDGVILFLLLICVDENCDGQVKRLQYCAEGRCNGMVGRYVLILHDRSFRFGDGVGMSPVSWEQRQLCHVLSHHGCYQEAEVSSYNRSARFLP
jgi:hypothetical protein